MDIFKFVHKYEKRLLFAFTVLIALSFGITGSMLTVLSRQDKDPAGQFCTALVQKEKEWECHRWETVSKIDFQNFKYRWNQTSQFWASIAGFPLSAQMAYLDNLLSPEAIEGFRSAAGGRNPNFGTIEETGLWNLLILLAEAHKEGLYVPDEAVSGWIEKKFARFHPDQPFDPKIYHQMLSSYGITPDQFEATLRDYLLLSQFGGLIQSSAVPKLEDAYHQFIHDHTRYKIELLSYPLSSFLHQEIPAQITRSELLNDYQTQHLLKRPPAVSFEYVLARNDDFTSQVPAPSEQELRHFYDENKTSLPELYTVEPAHSKDPSPPKTPKPFHASDVQMFLKQTLLEEKAKDLARQAIDHVKDYLFDHYAQDVFDFSSLARKFPVRTRKVEALDYDRLSSLGFGSDLDALKTRLQRAPLGTPDMENLIDTGAGFLLLRVLQRRDAQDVPFPFVEETYQPRLHYEIRLKKAGEKAREKIRSLKKELDTVVAALQKKAHLEQSNPIQLGEKKKEVEKTAFERVAKSYSLSPVVSGFFLPSEGVFPPSSPYPNLREVAEEVQSLSSKSKDVSSPWFYGLSCTAKNCYVFFVLDEKRPDPQDFEAHQNTYLDSLRRQAEKDRLQNFLKYLKDQAKLKTFKAPNA